MNPMAPAIIQVNSTDPNNTIKTMLWPIQYAIPNASQQSSLPEPPKLPEDVPSDIVSIVTIPESVVAVRTFSDMIIEPLVRKVDQTLRQSLQRDGLQSSDSTAESVDVSTITTKLLTFAQYDAIYSMGERRCEVHITLPPGTHPWC
jgi:type II secretory pathway component HofQ